MTTPATQPAATTTTPPAGGAPAGGAPAGGATPAAPAPAVPPAGATSLLVSAPTTAPSKPSAEGTTPPAKEGAAPGAEPTKNVEPGKGAEPEFKLAVPEGVTADTKLLSGFADWAKGHKLTAEQAQGAVDLFAKSAKENQAAAQASWEQEQKQLAEKARGDKEYGGANFAANLELAHKALLKLASPELLQKLDATGLGNDPEMVRLFYRLGKADAEDSVTGTDGQPTAEDVLNDPQARRRLAYPSLFKKKE